MSKVIRDVFKRFSLGFKTKGTVELIRTEIAERGKRSIESIGEDLLMTGLKYTCLF